MFHSSNLSGFVPTMKEGAARLMARLHRAQREGKEVDMKRLLGDMTMDVVGSTAFGCVESPPSWNRIPWLGRTM